MVEKRGKTQKRNLKKTQKRNLKKTQKRNLKKTQKRNLKKTQKRSLKKTQKRTHKKRNLKGGGPKLDRFWRRSADEIRDRAENERKKQQNAKYRTLNESRPIGLGAGVDPKTQYYAEINRKRAKNNDSIDAYNKTHSRAGFWWLPGSRRALRILGGEKQEMVDVFTGKRRRG